MRWPGAVTVAKGGKFCSVYVGDGSKRGDCSFNPTETPEVCDDPKDKDAQPEPQGKDPEEVKPVEENKEEGEEEDDE